jgi:hypothetical protein
VEKVKILMNTIQVSGNENIRIAITKEAVLAMQSAIALSSQISKVDSDTTALAASQARLGIKDVLKEVEKSRKDVKAPLLKLGKDIDQKAQDFCAPLLLEDRRLESMQTPYEEAKRKESEKAETERLAELKRIDDERVAADEKALAEQLEFAVQAYKAKTAEDKAKAESDLKMAQERAMAQLKELDACREMAGEKIEAKTDGVRMRKDWEIEILNASEAYKAHPNWFKLVPDMLRIKDFYKANPQAVVVGVMAREVSKTY